MSYSNDFRTQAWLDKNNEAAARNEEIDSAYKCGERFETYAQIMVINGDQIAIPGLLDIYVDSMGLDLHDPEIEEAFEAGSPTASRLRNAAAEARRAA